MPLQFVKIPFRNTSSQPIQSPRFAAASPSSDALATTLAEAQAFITAAGFKPTHVTLSEGKSKVIFHPSPGQYPHIYLEVSGNRKYNVYYLNTANGGFHIDLGRFSNSYYWSGFNFPANRCDLTQQDYDATRQWVETLKNNLKDQMNIEAVCEKFGLSDRWSWKAR